jgi:pyruvate dehydrogenase (quinone)/pyruvate oxidase
MANTAADVLIETLHDWGIDTIFGLPGDGINGIMESLRKHKDKVRFVQVRHEEAAAFMACAYAKYTGRLGCCLATSGPGGIHLLNGLYDAKIDGAPVVAITGMHYHDLLCTHSQQDVELDKLFIDVSVYNARVMGPAHMENVAELACRNAYTKRGVAHITIPTDFQDMEVSRKRASPRNVPHHTSDVKTYTQPLPSEGEFNLAAEILNSGRKVAILCGQGALNATDELIETAELLGAPIIKALLGKAAVPDDCPYTTGGIGLLGTRPSVEALEDCDTLLIVGSSFPYIEFMPKPGQARCVQIDLDGTRIGLRYPAEVGLVGDSKICLRNLIPRLKRHNDRGFIEKAQAGMRDWWKLIEKRATRDDKPLKPQVVAWELGKRLDSQAIVSCDSGTITSWFAREMPVKRGQKYSLSGTLATMACGLPYAIAAAVAFPERPSFAFVGDGGFSMLMAELVTAVKYKLNVKIVVIKNNALGQIKWEQMVFLGNPEFGCELEPIDFALLARAMGAQSFTIDDPRTCGAILDQAINTAGPVLIEAVVDPLEAPMPPKVTFEQAKHFAEALLRGTKDAGKIAKTIAEDKVKETV